MKIRIRRARAVDAETIADLWLAMMQEHRSFERRVQLSDRAQQVYAKYARHHAAQEDSVVFVAEILAQGVRSKNPLIGFSLSYRVRNLPMFLPEYYGFISDVTVASGFRGQGHGRRMIEETEAVFRTMGLSHVQLQVYLANDGARRFWRSHGFETHIQGMWKDL